LYIKAGDHGPPSAGEMVLPVLLALLLSGCLVSGQEAEEGALRQPKLFYVSTSTTTSTVNTMTLCYHESLTIQSMYQCRKRKKRQVLKKRQATDLLEGEIISPTNLAGQENVERQVVEVEEVEEGRREGEGRFLNYWMTTTTTATSFSYTVTSKLGSVVCTPEGFSYLLCGVSG
jgi:hypothetical protein